MKKTKKFLPLVFLIAIVMMFSACGPLTPNILIEETPPPPEEEETTTPPTEIDGIMQWSSPPPMTIDPDKEYEATIKTNFGDIVVQFFPKDAPLAVNNFVFLSRQGFYDGVTFHKVVKDYIITTGDPTGTGRGGPGYTFPDEEVTREYVAGTVAMLTFGPDTNGSQFFITLINLSNLLPKMYTIFGQVTDGFDVLQEIGDVPVTASETGGLSKPAVDVHIDTIIIEEK
jgi:cyclophilin family peptidyl-prolyl cis-trans isomerase